MARYEILGGRPLEGTVTISGAKNAAVAILPAALLVSGRCRIENVPDISDVRILLQILDHLGAKIQLPEPGVVEIDCSDVQRTRPDPDMVCQMRASYYFLGALLGRFGKAHVALPGGSVVPLQPVSPQDILRLCERIPRGRIQTPRQRNRHLKVHSHGPVGEMRILFKSKLLPPFQSHHRHHSCRIHQTEIVSNSYDTINLIFLNSCITINNRLIYLKILNEI